MTDVLERFCVGCGDIIEGIDPDGMCPNDCGTCLDPELAAEWLEERDQWAREQEQEERWMPDPFGFKHHSAAGMPWWR